MNSAPMSRRQWQDLCIELRSESERCPVVTAVLALARHREMTEREVLMTMVKELSNRNDRLLDMLTHSVMQSSTQVIVSDAKPSAAARRFVESKVQENYCKLEEDAANKKV